MVSVKIIDFYSKFREYRIDGIEHDTDHEELRRRIHEVSGIPVHRQRIYHKGKVVTGLETFTKDDFPTEYVMLRLPRKEKPANEEVFEKGDLKHGKINIATLKAVFDEECPLTVEQAEAIITRGAHVLSLDENLVSVVEPAVIVGDIHGQWFDLEAVFAAGGGIEQSNWVFLGDYVDRGRFSSEVALLTLALKVNEPKRITLLRGNHESASQMKKQGTDREFTVKYREETHALLIEAYHRLPVAAVVESGGKKLFCCHGGIGPRVVSLDAVRSLEDRVCEPTSNTLIRDLTWSDPADSAVASPGKPKERSWNLRNLPAAKPGTCRAQPELTKALFEPNPSRGSSIAAYTLEAVHTFLRLNDLLCIVRGHEQKDGFEFCQDGPDHSFPSVITVFSAPNYTDKSKNLGGVLTLTSGTLTLQEYPWSLHPHYDTLNRKDLPREDFHVFIHSLDAKSLMDLTEDQLDAAYGHLYPRIPSIGISARDMWKLIRDNLEIIPELVRSSQEDLRSMAMTLAEFFQKCDHLRRGIAAEKENELDTFSSDEDRPYETTEKVPLSKSQKKKQKKRLSEERYERAFSLFDADGSGEISEREISLAMRQLGRKCSPEDAKRLMEQFDTNKDGVLSLSEFTQFVKTFFPAIVPPTPMRKANTSAHGDSTITGTPSSTKFSVLVDNAWKAIDSDHSSQISCAEMARIIGMLGVRVTPSEVVRMMTRASVGDDMLISRDEFESCLCEPYEPCEPCEPDDENSSSSSSSEEGGRERERDRHHHHHHHNEQ